MTEKCIGTYLRRNYTNMEQKKSIWIKLFYGITILLLITWTLSAKLYIDESFTLGLIKHNWLEVIKLDAMDVHPPLYYLVLKLFLNITTFWTSSMFMKAIFARIFSVICFAIMSKGIQIIFKKSLNKTINFNIIFLGLLLLPNILYHATCIRMYAFGAMLITWELVCLINYQQQNKTSYLVYALILAELAAYTHYFAAIIGGLLLVYEFLSSIKHKNYNATIKIGISGITLFLFFIPWILVALKQFSDVSRHYWITNNLENYVDLFYYRKFPIVLFNFISFILFLIFSIYCYYCSSKKFKFIYRRVLFSFYGAMLIGISLSFLIRPIFQSRYLFFIFPIYLSILIFELICLLKKYWKKIKIWVLIIILFFSIGLFRNVIKGIYYLGCDYNICKNLKSYKMISPKKISSKFKENTFLTLQYSIYLPDNKFIIYHNKKGLSHTIQTGNSDNDKYLFEEIYPNIKFYSKN